MTSPDRRRRFRRLEHDHEFRPRLLKHPGLSATEYMRAVHGNGNDLDAIGDAQGPPCQRRIVEDESK